MTRSQVVVSHSPGNLSVVNETLMPGDDVDPASATDLLSGLIRKTIYLGWLLGGLLVVMVGVSVYMTATTEAPAPTVTSAPTDMLAVAPGGVIELADIPEPFLVHYEGASDHPDVFSVVPCFCGCEAMLEHRHLLDCFVRPDGEGWEAHATGCGVCLGEAEQVLALIADGIPPDEIVEQIVTEWGDPYLDQE